MVSRLIGASADDPTLPPSTRGTERIAPVKNITSTGPYKTAFGDNYTLSWTPPDGLPNISFYLIYVYSYDSEAPLAVYACGKAPCTVTLSSLKSQAFKIKIQPVLRSGLSANLDSCGTTAVYVSGTPIAIQGNSMTYNPNSPSCGVAVLSGGTVTVDSSIVTAGSVVMTSRQNGLNSGFLTIANIIPNSSFDIISTNASDDGEVFWLLFNPK